MNHTFDKYDSYLSMKPRFSRDSLADISSTDYYQQPMRNLILSPWLVWFKFKYKIQVFLILRGLRSSWSSTLSPSGNQEPLVGYYTKKYGLLLVAHGKLSEGVRCIFYRNKDEIENSLILSFYCTVNCRLKRYGLIVGGPGIKTFAKYTG